MNGKWCLRSIQISGYLGIGAQPLQLDFESPVVVLFGPTGSGKSTIVSAIEWALFGEPVLGSNFDVAELKGNQLNRYRVYMHEGVGETEVTLKFKNGRSSMVWRRLRRYDEPRPVNDEVTCHVDEAQIPADVTRVFGLTPALYSRVVAPRQTSLLALVSFEDAERNNALDHLVGVEQINTLTVGLSRAQQRLNAQVKALEDRFSGVASRLRKEVAERFDRRAAARQKAIQYGVAPVELTIDGALMRLSTLSGEMSIPFAAAPHELSYLEQQLPAIEAAAEKAWAQPPASRRLTRLRQCQSGAQINRGMWQAALSVHNDAVRKGLALEQQFGSEDTAKGLVDKAIQNRDAIHGNIASVNQRAAVLKRAREWLEQHQHEPGEEVGCPVCERPILVRELSDLVDSTLAAIEGANGQIAHLDGELRQADQALKEAQDHARQLARGVEAVTEAKSEAENRKTGLVNALQSAMSRWVQDAPDKIEEPIKAKCGEAITLARPVKAQETAGESPDESLDRCVRRLLEMVEGAVAATEEEVAQASSRAQAARQRVLATQHLVAFLKSDRHLADLDSVVSGAELIAARAGLQVVQQWREVLRAVTTAAQEVSVAEAEKRVYAVSPKLNEWFSRISRHDRLKGARVEVRTSKAGGRVTNAYRVRVLSHDATWEVSPGPRLSGGYHTVLTVATLCALAEVEAGGHLLGLMVLDEPTQNLDAEMRRSVGAALGGFAPAQLTIVTTADEELVQVLQQAAGAGRTKVARLKPWKAATGTQLDR